MAFSDVGSTVGYVDVHQLRDDIIALEARLDALQPKIERQNLSLQTQIALLNASLSLAVRLTGDENLDRGIRVIARAITIVRQLHIASTLLMASSPWLWALGLIGVAGMAVTTAGMADMVTGY